MKRKLLVLIFVFVIAVTVTGCNKKKNSKVSNSGPRVVCTNTETMDGIEATTKVTLKFNDDNYVNYQATEIIMKFNDEDVYNSYLAAMKQNNENKDKDENVVDELDYDDKKMTITSTTIYSSKSFDYSKLTDSEIDSMTAASLVKGATENDYKCKYIDVTKKELGIK